MMIQEHCDEHRMLKHKEYGVLIMVTLRENTIIITLDALYQVFENTRQHNEWLREMNQVFENTRQHNDWLRETNQVFENMRQHNDRRQETNQVF